MKKLSLLGFLALFALISPATILANSTPDFHVRTECNITPPEGKPIYLTNSKYRIQPLDLNNRILTKKNVPVILNVSSETTAPAIKGSLKIGDMNEHTFEDLKFALKQTPKNKEIVVYCGCCTLDNCERVEKAFNLLVANGYTNVKVLNLIEGFYPDWNGKGYAVQ